jgi:hypothetical protein
MNDKRGLTLESLVFGMAKENVMRGWGHNPDTEGEYHLTPEEEELAIGSAGNHWYPQSDEEQRLQNLLNGRDWIIQGLRTSLREARERIDELEPELEEDWDRSYAPRSRKLYVPDEELPDIQNPKDSIGQTKVPLTSLPVAAQVWGTLGMAEGARKYGEKNFRYADVAASVYTSAIRRHLSKWEEGQEKDPVSRIHELGSVIAGAAILLDAQFQGTLIDDRHKSNVAHLNALFDEAQAVIAHLNELFGSDTRLLEDR